MLELIILKSLGVEMTQIDVYKLYPFVKINKL